MRQGRVGVVLGWALTLVLVSAPPVGRISPPTLTLVNPV